MNAATEPTVGLEQAAVIECAVAYALTLSDGRVFAVCAAARRALPGLSAAAREQIAATIDAALIDGRVKSRRDIIEWSRTAWSLRTFDDRGVSA